MASRTLPLLGKYALVTGASRGIGAAIALEFAHRGASGVAITYGGNKGLADSMLSQLREINAGIHCTAIQADLLATTDFGETVVRDALKGLETERIDILVNCAAIMDQRASEPFETCSLQAFDRMMHANLWAPMQLIRSTLPHIPAGGRIINISSTSSRRANPDPIMVYGMSKAGLDSMTRSLATKYAAVKHITVNSVSVGPTNTGAVQEFWKGQSEEVVQRMKNSATAEKRIGEPEDVARIVSFLASEDSRWVNGAHMMANGGSMLELQG